LLAQLTMLIALLALAPWRASAQAAHAQAPAVVDVEVRSKRKISASHTEDPSAAGTQLDLTDRVTLPRTLADVVREAPGTRVTSIGGLGAFSSVSLRGADAEETYVLLDEIPLVTPDGGAFDLSFYPAELFERVNVFRGGAPAWFGSGAIGGVLQLVPRRSSGDGAQASLGYGSFDTWQLSGGTELSLPNGWSQHNQLVVRGSRGDYPYRDDRTTLFDPSDDATFRRKNGQLAEGSGFQDLRLPLWGGTLHLLAIGFQRAGGFPGPAPKPTPNIRRDSARALLGAAYDREGTGDSGERARTQLLLSGAYGGERYVDRLGELGINARTESNDRSFRLFARGAEELWLARWLKSTLLASFALDALLPFDRYVFPRPRALLRQTAVGGVETAVVGALGDVRYEIRPSARLEWSRTELEATPAYRDSYLRDRRILVPTYRLGAVLEPLRGFALSTSVASGTRLPTFFELFGDRGINRPNFGLEPVRSITVDGGASLRRRLGLLHGGVELRAFHQRRRDAIATTLDPRGQLRRENISEVESWGIESALDGKVGSYFAFNGSLTYQQAESALGARIALRPRLVTYVRPELRIPLEAAFLSSVSASAEFWHRGFMFTDAANLAYLPACNKVALSSALSMFEERVRLTARMDDAGDARCSDLLGYPMPGRSLFFSLSYQEVLHDRS
jgi:iron complex outermembrane receptor protein